MQRNFEVQHLTRQQINAKSWDECISKAYNGLIYAKSFFLDALADNWDALVLGNYEIVMPLPWRKKWSIRYVYQVPFLQRLSIYGSAVDESITAFFFQKAIQIFKFINYKTDIFLSIKAMAPTICKNYILPLHQPYQTIYNSYTTECKKNIRKAETRGCILKEYSNAELTIAFFKETYGQFYEDYSNKLYSKLALLIEDGMINGFCKSYSVLVEEKVVFAASVFYDEKRIYYLIGAPNDQGRQARAPYFFINEIIKITSGKNLLFDFEGSDIPNVASFYSKFSPDIEEYYDVLINHLPAPLKWLKQK